MQLDRASLLGEAIVYIKALQQQLQVRNIMKSYCFVSTILF